jgi:hypothetical protein
MTKASSLNSQRMALSLNGWTFGHALFYFSLTSLFMIWDAISKENTLLAYLLLFLGALCLLMPSLKSAKIVYSFCFVAIWALYAFFFCQFTNLALCLFTWPVWVFYTVILVFWSLSSSQKFFWQVSLFEGYRLALACSSFVALLFVDFQNSYENSFFWMATLLWSMFLLTSAFLWQLRFPHFVKALESLVVVSSLAMIYSSTLVNEFAFSKAFFVMSALSSWNLLVWPARRQERASVEYLQWSSLSKEGLGIALFLISEQWRSSPICFKNKEEGWSVIDEKAEELKESSALWYVLEATGGFWTLLATFMKNSPLFIQKQIQRFIEYKLCRCENDLTREEIDQIKKRRR